MNILAETSLIVFLIILLEAITSGGITGSKERKIFKSHNISLYPNCFSEMFHINSITLPPIQEKEKRKKKPS